MKPKRTILCVDDNEQSLSIRKVMLETRGYRVIACSSGEEALERFKKGGVDLVLTDLVMPGVDGSKLIDAIKTLSPQTPAILLSGKVRIYDRDTRADVFLPKGMYAPVELLERIRLLLVRKRGPKRAQSQAQSARTEPALPEALSIREVSHIPHVILIPAVLCVLRSGLCELCGNAFESLAHVSAAIQLKALNRKVRKETRRKEREGSHLA